MLSGVNAERSGGKIVRAGVDGAHSGHNPNQVEPGADPTPASAAENAAPMIQPARGRKGGGHLGHGNGHHQREQARQRPANPDACASYRTPTHVKRSDASS